MVATDVIAWGYQPLFCRAASNRAKTLFDALDPLLEAEVFLVGLGNSQVDAQAIFLEAVNPERVAPALEGFSKTLEEVTERVCVSSRHDASAGPPGVAEQYEQRVPLKVATSAVWEHLRRSSLAAERRFWAGYAYDIEGYRIVPVLALSKAVVDRYPSLSKSSIGRVPVPTSLIDAVAVELMDRCARALRLPNPGENVRADLDFGDPDDIIRRAASHMMSAPVLAGKKIEGLEVLLSTCDALSAEPYERSATHAKLFVCARGHPSIEPLLELADPVKLGSTRAARKILQMSTAGLSMLSDGVSIWGLGQLSSRESYDATREDLFEICFTGRLRWELRHANKIIFQVENRRISFAREPLPREEFETFLDRMFPRLAAQQTFHLWECVSSVLEARHGAILIITPEAKREAERLKSQGTPITSKLLDSDVLAAATRIDGAVLLDINGVCHAVGVILDGVATQEGKRSRGSRFNSALRYVTYQQGSAAVVISDDGSVDLLPSLMPRVSRGAVKSALNELRALASGPYPFERLDRVMEALYALEFYLSAEECAEANSLRAKIEAYHPLKPYEVRLKFHDLVPSPGMNPSYFTDDLSQWK